MNTKFNISVLSGSVLLACIAAPFNASAHGYMDSPKARQAFCQAQGGYWWPEDGSNIPNLACRAAFLESGHVQFIQEHEFAVNTPDYLNQAAVEANVPDGTLCAAGSHEKRGMNLPSAHWQKTVVTPNANGEIQVRYRATTPHNPSFWQFYLTKPGFNPATDTLTWKNIELIQSHDNIEFVKDPDGKRYYEMSVAIPAERAGEAVLYSRWQRVDVVGEGFYNCSDIIIERDTVTPVDWFPLGYFVRQGQNANAGDTVQVRLFDATGLEVVNQLFAVNASNQATWQSELAAKLNLDYASELQIGVKNASGDIVFDEANLTSNQVYATSSDHSFALSVIAASENTAPNVNPVADVVMDEGSQTLVHVHAFDDENDPLSYQFTVPNEFTYSVDGPNLTLNAPEVSANANFTIQVSVSDGKLSTPASFTVTVNDTATNPDVPAWDASKAYNAGDKVSYLGTVYKAKWWVQGEKPNSSDAWQSLSQSTDDAWLSSKAYSAGDIVSHNSQKYQARWWTKGEEPGTASVWQTL